MAWAVRHFPLPVLPRRPAWKALSIKLHWHLTQVALALAASAADGGGGSSRGSGGAWIS
jgi:hypothetical protein